MQKTTFLLSPEVGLKEAFPNPAGTHVLTLARLTKSPEGSCDLPLAEESLDGELNTKTNLDLPEELAGLCRPRVEKPGNCVSAILLLADLMPGEAVKQE